MTTLRTANETQGTLKELPCLKRQTTTLKSIMNAKLSHIAVEAGFQSLKSTIAETGVGVTSRP